MTRADWLAFAQATGAVGVVLLICGVVWLVHDLLADRREQEPEGATEEWRPKTEYRDLIAERTLDVVATGAAEHEPITTWEQKQRIFADEINWYRRKARAIRRWTQAFDTAELHALLDRELVLVEPVRTVTGPGEWSQPTLTLRGVVGYGDVTRV